MAITLLLRRKETDSQISDPQYVRHLAMSGNVLYQHHEWEEHIYSFNKEQDRKKMTSIHTYLFRPTVTKFIIPQQYCSPLLVNSQSNYHSTSASNSTKNNKNYAFRKIQGGTGDREASFALSVCSLLYIIECCHYIFSSSTVLD